MKPKVRKVLEQLLAEQDPLTPTPSETPQTPNSLETTPGPTSPSSLSNPESVLRVLVTHLRELGWGKFKFERGSWLGYYTKHSDESAKVSVEVYHHDGKVHAAGLGIKGFAGTDSGRDWSDEVEFDLPELSRPLDGDMKDFAEEITDEIGAASSPENYPYSEPPTPERYSDE